MASRSPRPPRQPDGVGLAEGLEDVREEVGRDAGAVVADRHLGTGRAPPGETSLDVPALGRELDRVREEVDEDLLQQFGLARDGRLRELYPRPDLDRFVPRERHDGLDGRHDDGGERSAPRPKFRVGCARAREVEELPDEPLLKARVAPDDLHAPLEHVAVAAPLAYQLGPPEDGGRRRAQLVREHREEFVHLPALRRRLRAPPLLASPGAAARARAFQVLSAHQCAHR